MVELIRLSKFLVIIGGGLLVVDIIGFKALDHFFNTMHRGREYQTRLAMHEVSPDILFIGASQCSGNYDSRVFEKRLNTSVFNAGMGAQHIDYQEIISSTIISRKKPRVIVWDFDPKLLAPDNGVYLKTGMNPYYPENDLVKNKLDAVDTYMFLKHVFHSYRYNSLFFQMINGNMGSKENLRGFNPYPCGKLKEMEIVTQETYKELAGDSERKVTVMRSMLKAWKDQGIQVYVVVSPMYKKIQEPITGVLKAKEICGDANIPFFDFTQLEGIYDHPEYFRDHIHLCKTGAAIYSNYLIDNVLLSGKSFGEK